MGEKFPQCDVWARCCQRGDAGVTKCYCKNIRGPRISSEVFISRNYNDVLFLDLRVGYMGVFSLHRCTDFMVCSLSVSYYVVQFKKQKRND